MIAVVAGWFKAFSAKALSVGAFFANTLEVAAAIVPIGSIVGANGVVVGSAGFNGIHVHFTPWVLGDAAIVLRTGRKGVAAGTLGGARRDDAS